MVVFIALPKAPITAAVAESWRWPPCRIGAVDLQAAVGLEADADVAEVL